MDSHSEGMDCTIRYNDLPLLFFKKFTCVSTFDEGNPFNYPKTPIIKKW